MTTADFRSIQADHDRRNESATLAYAAFVSAISIGLLLRAWGIL